MKLDNSKSFKEQVKDGGFFIMLLSPVVAILIWQSLGFVMFGLGLFMVLAGLTASK